jgi:hypothetical protein
MFVVNNNVSSLSRTFHLQVLGKLLPTINVHWKRRDSNIIQTGTNALKDKDLQVETFQK